MTRRHDTWATKDNPIGLELYYSGMWNDITADLSDDGVEITRGRSAEGQGIDPSEMSCPLDNTGGTYSPRHPLSPLYGLVGRNTPIRFWVEVGQVRAIQSTFADYWSCPDSAGVSITGDIDLRVDLDIDSWRPFTSVYLGLRKQFAYGLLLQTDGRPGIIWSADGVNYLQMSADQALPGGSVGRKAVRATLDVNNGAAGRTAVFYYSDTLSGTWVQLGDPVTAAGTTSIVNNATTLTTLCGTGVSTATSVFAAEVRDGIDGTVVASPTFTSQTSGAVSFADAQGNIWTPVGAGTVSDRHYRFWGEVVAWPQRWTTKGSPYTPITCAGVMRRLGQGTAPVQSPMRRALSSIGVTLVGYWPMEDAAGSTSLAAVVGTPASIAGVPTVAAYEGFAASDPLPLIESGKITAAVTTHADTGYSQTRWLGVIPSGTTDGLIVARIAYTGTLARVDIRYNTAASGTLTILGYDRDGVSVGSVAHAVGCTGQHLRVSVQLDQNGANIDATLVTYEVGASVGYTTSGSLTGATIGRAHSVTANPNLSTLTGVAFGHLTVETAITTLFDVSTAVLAGHLAEAADTRVARLGTENDVTVAVIGAGGDAESLGIQTRADLVTLLRDAATADMGMLYEPRTSDDLAYRTHESMLSQPAGVTIAYTDNLLLPFEPTEDDQRTRNKVTITRDGGSSATAEVTTGPLSTQAPPNGVGVYESTETISLASDGLVMDQASWRAHIGTVDEARWPAIGIDLAHPTFLADTALTRQILDLDLGDRIVVTNLPSWLPPDDVDQLVQGYSETVSPTHYKLILNCTPASPYRVAWYDDGVSRYSGKGTVLAEDLTTTETGIDIINPDGCEWTHADGDYTIAVGGETMTVTAVSGTGTSQTLTVTRSTNGVVKTHSTGAALDLATLYYYGL